MPAAVLLPEPPSTSAPAVTTSCCPPLRPRRQLVLLAFALFVCLWLVSWFGLLGELEIYIGAQPVTVELKGLRSPDQLTVTSLTTVGDSDGDQKDFGIVIPREQLMFPDAARSTWRIAGYWIKTIHITAPEWQIQGLQSVDIRIGDQRRTYLQTDLASWKRLPRPFTGLLPNRSESAVSIELPAPKDTQLPAINSAGMGTLVQRLFAFPILGLALALLSGWMLVLFARSTAGTECWNSITERVPPVGQASGLQPASGRPVPQNGHQNDWLWFCAGLALSAAGIGILYARYSYPFTQDDNFSQFLPMVLYNCHALLAGHWPAWNPHQFLGAPVATMGIYSVTYPPIYLAYGLARLARNEYWTIEVYTLLHLAAGYTLLYLLLRRIAIRPSLAATAGASFVLSGWFLVAGRSQMTFAPLAVWPVALAWSVHHLATTKRVTWTWTLLSALSIGLFFHAGHSQMWVYGMMFYMAGIGVYWFSGSLTWKQVTQVLPALLMGVGLAAPLLILQAIEGTSSARAGSYGDRIEFLHMLLPLGSLFPRPISLGSAGYEYFAEMYYSGTLFQALSLLALLTACARFALCRGGGYKELREWLGANAWVVLFAIAILFGLGSKGILWTAFSQLPIFDRFRWPIKFAYFCLLYSTLGGAIIAERWFRRWPKLHYPALAAVACLLLFHVNLCKTSWYDFADRPFPSLPGFMESRVTQPEGRLLTRWQSMDRSALPGFYKTLSLDFATQAGAYAVGGYDTFLEGSLVARRVRQRFWADPLAAAKAYGVRWVVSDATFDQPETSPNSTFWSLEAPSIGNLLAIHAVEDAAQLVGTEDGLTLHELSGYDPSAFVDEDAPAKRPLPIRMNAEGVVVDTSSVKNGHTVICNIAMRPWMKALNDHGQAVPAEADHWGRVRIHISQPTAKVAVAYRPPWAATLLCGALLMLVGATSGVWPGKLNLGKHNHRQPDQR